MALAEEESLVPCVVGELVGELAAEVGATEGIPVDGNGLDEKEEDIVTTRWGVCKARERYRLPINYVGLMDMNKTETWTECVVQSELNLWAPAPAMVRYKGLGGSAPNGVVVVVDEAKALWGCDQAIHIHNPNVRITRSVGARKACYALALHLIPF